MVEALACSEVAAIITGGRAAAAVTRRCRSGTGGATQASYEHEKSVKILFTT
jgi:hypothetical protein